MTENQLREKFVNIAVGYLGCKVSDGSHRKIIDLYNSYSPLPRGHRMTYTDPWCAAFASAVAVSAGLTDIIPVECSCNKMIELLKKLGAWVEDDSYRPKIGDLVFYDWQDDGVGDCIGESDHVGIAVSCDGKTIRVIEGNRKDAVAYREISVNGRYIRGFGAPKFSVKATASGDDGVRTHTVVRGDTLWAIAKKYLGSGARWREIQSVNGLKSDVIRVGQVLKIPGK